MAQEYRRASYDRNSVHRSGQRSRSNHNRNMGRDEYVYGNTARALRPIDEEVKSPKKLSHRAHKNIDRDTSMNPGFMFFLTLAMVLTGVVCMQYIRLQSSVTAYVDKLSRMEIQLEELKAENDDYESRIKGTVGLEDIKRRAMNDLGMTYASDDQIVIYDSDGTDYVRQFVSLE